jgi:anti-sigma factor RsiW
MSGWRRTNACDRAARSISLELDGGLGRRERAVLARHLARCPDCTRLRESLAAVTTILRLTPPEVPGRHVAVPVSASAQPARLPRGLASALALAAAAATAVALFALPQGTTPAPTTAVVLAARARSAEADRILASPPLTPPVMPLRPAPPFLACSIGCWPQAL